MYVSFDWVLEAYELELLLPTIQIHMAMAVVLRLGALACKPRVLGVGLQCFRCSGMLNREPEGFVHRIQNEVNEARSPRAALVV